MRRHEIKRNAPHVSLEDIVSGLVNIGIDHGETIFVHSSLSSLGFVEGGAKIVLAALREAIGPQGTLILPTYYQPGGTIYATCKIPDYIFDPAIHGTDLGALPAAFLKLEGLERSLHPTHSVSAIGPKARFVTEDHHKAPSIFGVGSPWERFLQLDGRVLGLGVSMGPVTFYHMLEDLSGDAFPLPVRMKEVYGLHCRKPSGEVIRVPIVPLDPKYISRRIDSPSREDLRQYFWCEFERAGLLTTGCVGQAKSWTIGARVFYDHLKRLMAEGITIYSTPKDLAHRPII